MLINTRSIKNSCHKLLISIGVKSEISKSVLSSLINSDLCGHPSHGLMRLPSYIDKIFNKKLLPNKLPSITHSNKTLLKVDGNWGFGQVSASFIANRCVKKFTNTPISIATLNNTNHVGRLSDYSKILAKNGFLSIIYSNLHGTSHIVSPYGGITRKLPSNPICYSLPYSKNYKKIFVSDFATSSLAEGKLKISYHKNKKITGRHIIDYLGNISNDPKTFYTFPYGSLLNFGGDSSHKGYCLSLAIDILAGALSGAGCSSPKYNRHGNALTLVNLKIDKIIDYKYFCKEVLSLKKHVISSKLQKNTKKIYFPGEIEELNFNNNKKRGTIVLDKKTISDLKTLFSKSNIRYDNF